MYQFCVYVRTYRARVRTLIVPYRSLKRRHLHTVRVLLCTQGFAGFIDRFGQALGPIAGSVAYNSLGEVWLMRSTGLGLGLISALCCLFLAKDQIAHLCHSPSEYCEVSTKENVEFADEVGEDAHH